MGCTTLNVPLSPQQNLKLNDDLLLQTSVRLGTNVLQLVSLAFKYSTGCSTLHSESTALFFKPFKRKTMYNFLFATWKWQLVVIRRILYYITPITAVLTECFDFRRIHVRNDVKHPSQRLVSKVVVVVHGGIRSKCRSERMMSAQSFFVAPSEHVPFTKRSTDLRFGFDCL